MTLARRLGLDGNPLRRRTDKIATCLAFLLVAVFLVGAPWLSVAAVGWAGHSETAAQQTRSWYQVQARRFATDGRAKADGSPAIAGSAAGRTIRLPTDETGSPAGSAPSRSAVLAREVAAVVLAPVVLGIVLLCLVWGGRWVLDRRRLAGWEAAWAAVGPRWTKRFRSRG
jgi:hypothetical protein